MKPEQQPLTDEQLAARFATMRAEDSQLAPAFAEPGQGAVRARQGITSFADSGMVRGALAASLLLAFAFWFTAKPTPEDPAMLYAQVMDGYRLSTDELLFVSDSTLPEMTDLPELVSPLSGERSDASIN